MNDNLWSVEQNEIFNWFATGAGALVIQARAGTGKTTTIKAAFEKAPESRMLYAVFNKKNQVEAAAKIADPRVDIKTLHSLGFSFILSMWPGVKPDGAVEFDRVRGGQDYPSDAVVAAVKLVGFAKNLLVNPTIEHLVAIANDRGIDCGEDLEEAGYTVGKIASMAMAAMERAKVRDSRGRISFDDMVWLPVAMGWARPRYDLVVVDEAQDMNLPQLLMARAAVRSGGRICIVGDDRQAIYGFRGAASDGMGMMRRELNAAVLPLTTTYRCPKAVVALAAELVPDYHAAPSAPEGSVTFTDLGNLLSVVVPGDAILSRTNAPLMPICLQLLRAGTPARIEGRDVGQMLAALVKKLNARSVPDFLRRVSRWQDRQIKRLKAAEADENRLAAVEDQAAVLVAVAEGASSISEVLSRLNSLFVDSTDNQRPAVVLSSVHKAKGLEWEHVYLLPTFKRTGDEENNIKYVAITRSKSVLTFVA